MHKNYDYSLRVRQQEEEHRQAVLESRRLAAERAEKEKQLQDQEELDRQAASTEVPAEQVQVAELEVPGVPPLIGENGENGENSEPQTVESSTTSESTSASTRMYRQERRDSENYWANIIDIMYEYFHDENLISNAESLHEGVLIPIPHGTG
eukprot:294470-Amphidinium_carterae.1